MACIQSPHPALSNHERFSIGSSNNSVTPTSTPRKQTTTSSPFSPSPNSLSRQLQTFSLSRNRVGSAGGSLSSYVQSPHSTHSRISYHPDNEDDEEDTGAEIDWGSISSSPGSTISSNFSESSNPSSPSSPIHFSPPQSADHLEDGGYFTNRSFSRQQTVTQPKSPSPPSLFSRRIGAPGSPLEISTLSAGFSFGSPSKHPRSPISPHANSDDEEEVSFIKRPAFFRRRAFHSFSSPPPNATDNDSDDNDCLAPPLLSAPLPSTSHDFDIFPHQLQGPQKHQLGQRRAVHDRVDSFAATAVHSKKPRRPELSRLRNSTMSSKSSSRSLSNPSTPGVGDQSFEFEFAKPSPEAFRQPSLKKKTQRQRSSASSEDMVTRTPPKELGSLPVVALEGTPLKKKTTPPRLQTRNNKELLSPFISFDTLQAPPITRSASTSSCSSFRSSSSLGSSLGAGSTTSASPDEYFIKMRLQGLEGDFEVLGKIGSGEGGDVFKVARGAGLVTALKRSKVFSGNKDRLRHLEEVDCLSHLSPHPNIVHFISSAVHSSRLYIETSFCPHGDLAEFLLRVPSLPEEELSPYGGLDATRSWKVLAQLASALGWIHSAGFLHLDIKPSNIFIDEDDQLRIGDFGHATRWPRAPLKSPVLRGGDFSLDEDVEEEVRFEREGDRDYLCGEILRDGIYGWEADIFSLGMVMLEAYTCIIPPSTDAPFQKLRSDDFSDLDLESQGVSQASISILDEELMKLIRRMMSSDPSQRPSVCDILQHEIMRACRESTTKPPLHREFFSIPPDDGPMEVDSVRN